MYVCHIDTCTVGSSVVGKARQPLFYLAASLLSCVQTVDLIPRATSHAKFRLYFCPLAMYTSTSIGIPGVNCSLFSGRRRPVRRRLLVVKGQTYIGDMVLLRARIFLEYTRQFHLDDGLKPLTFFPDSLVQPILYY